MHGQTNVTAEVSVDTTDFLIGDWINVDVRLFHPEGTVLTSMTVDTLGPFLVLEQEPVRSISGEESAAGFRIAIYDTGRVAVPSFRFLYELPGDSTTGEVLTGPIDVVVHAVPVDTTADIRDIKPPLGLAYTWSEILSAVAVVFLLAVLVWLLVRLFRRRRNGGSERIAEVIETKPPHILAREQLQVIDKKRLWQNGHLKQYQTEVTAVIRVYLEGRFGIGAPEMTTTEILMQMEPTETSTEVVGELEKMLRRADLVKFAKHRTLPEENSETMDSAFSLVEKTTCEPASDVEEGAEHVQA
jgi:hypothetical protein